MYYADTTDRISDLELKNRKISRNAACEGIVLLKNDGVLPIRPCRIALYGNGARKTVKGGCGSGDVNERSYVTVEEGLEQAGFQIMDKRWLDAYDRSFEQDRTVWKEELLKETARRRTHIDVVYLETPHTMPTGDVVAKDELPSADAAFYVIARRSTEGNDRQDIGRDYRLSDVEKRNIQLLSRHYERFVLILNVPGPVDITEFHESIYVNAVLLISQGGLETGNAAADVLTGKVVPSGRLTDTWARSYSDYPFTEEFSYAGSDEVVYREGIYVGYRWFDKMKKTPLYPFGYGLSYTDFSLYKEQFLVDESGIEVGVRVQNIGDCSAKEVVQIYCKQPKGALEKAVRVLAGFEKTRLLKPGEEQTIKVRICWDDLASYEEATGCMVLESGTYEFLVSDSGKTFFSAGTAKLYKKRCVEELKNVDHTPLIPDEIMDFVRALPLEQRLELVTGAAPVNQDAVIGNGAVSVVGAAGETTRSIEGLPALILADGGSGIRLISHFMTDESGQLVPPDPMAGMERGAFSDSQSQDVKGTDYYQYCTSYPVGTALAQSWNRTLLREVGRSVAGEMKKYGIHLWLAPSVNIHRNPLCGRNFEYYSEDPFLAGELASELCMGVQETPGLGVTVKHFACNNQEYLRTSMNSVVSMQALYEIYLRVFARIIKKACPASIMTSYNQVNGVHSANNRWLCTEVARKQWGFDGIFMSDWGTTHHGASDPALCMEAGNDLIMPGRQKDRDRICEAVASGELEEEALNRCAARIVKVIWKLFS
ncbi:glycoside hydrolase family 3 N-terminal domain-containing protein [Streptococcus merionis]|uniref:glycoside hydrolase family 3 protein n=1 Tax=Streptococcus merionis TaxID=400065 RepID=UPI0026EB8998|nr:glycoside hydrolase family 3 protein [Streptococcus merionis]